jgi:hypothetical protein
VFGGANEALNRMEAAVVYRTVTPCDEFTVHDLLYWLWPARTVDTLLEAYDLTRETVGQGNCDFPGIIVPAGPVCRFYFNLSLGDNRLHFLPPAEKPEPRADYPMHNTICNILKEVEHIHKQFNKVRTVLAWLEDNATPGAARFYFPAMCALLPAEHPINHADGIRYKEPSAPMDKVIPMMRECAGILASGIITLNMSAQAKGLTTWGVDVADGTKVEDATSVYLAYSQRFMLK